MGKHLISFVVSNLRNTKKTFMLPFYTLNGIYIYFAIFPRWNIEPSNGIAPLKNLLYCLKIEIKLKNYKKKDDLNSINLVNYDKGAELLLYATSLQFRVSILLISIGFR